MVNRIIQMTAQMVYRVQPRKGGISNRIKWLGN
jgi:hypothetical protein